ncbi:MAG: SH3 domain-containing protein [Bacteroidota bacterium]
METEQGFILMNRSEFKDWVMRQNVGRKITMIQNHHTYIPDYTTFKGNNHFALVIGMKNYHVNVRRWQDIGQQITTFPDGKIIVGTRPFDTAPACIKGNNAEAICIENIGNFDKGKDKMTDEHAKTILHVNAVLNLKFKLEANDTNNVYHHWFDLSSGKRKEGKGITKSCPGTNFFGGNKVKDAKKNFIPKLQKALKKLPEYKTVFNDSPVEDPIGYAMVLRANQLNVRTGPSVHKARAGSLMRGSVVDIYERQGRWARISTEQKWVSSFYLKEIFKGVVIDEDPKGLSVRTGPGRKFRKVDALLKDTPVTVFETSENNWHRISFLDMWVSGKYVRLFSTSD